MYLLLANPGNKEAVRAGEPRNETLSSVLATAQNRSKAKARGNKIPSLQVQLSTPRDYLHGARDDFMKVWPGSIFTEYSFELDGDTWENFGVHGLATTDQNVKPLHERDGLQFAFIHRIPTSGYISEDEDTAKAKLDLSYGARFFRFRESFWLIANGGFFYQYSYNASLNNNFFGPQVKLNWSKRHRGWDLQMNLATMLGYDFLQAIESSSWKFNYGSLRFSSSSGLSQPFVRNQIHEQEDFATVAEVRTTAVYPIVEGVKFRIGYVGLYFSQLQRMNPRFGLPFHVGNQFEQDTPDQWFDQFHASLEWRR